jgi:hypothetical protein
MHDRQQWLLLSRCHIVTVLSGKQPLPKPALHFAHISELAGL